MSDRQRDIEALIYRLFVQFRELYRESPAEAMMRYGLSSKSGQKILAMSHEQITELASSGRLVFSIKLPSDWK